MRAALHQARAWWNWLAVEVGQWYHYGWVKITWKQKVRKYR